MLGLRPEDDAVHPAVAAFSIARLRRARAMRRAILALLALFILAGGMRLLGGRSSVVDAAGGGYELRLTYAPTARPGGDAEWSLEVRRPGGFAGPVEVATATSYLELFEQTRVWPQPRTSTADGERTIWTFDPPGADTLLVRIEGEFGQQSTGVHEGATSVPASARSGAEVRYRSRVLP
jgi:hypothetical protein